MKTRQQARIDSSPATTSSFLQLQKLHENVAASTSEASGSGSVTPVSSPSNQQLQKNIPESRNQKINDLEANPPTIKGKAPLIPMLSNHSVKEFVNKQIFTRLSPQAQVALLQLLPKCDVSKTNAGGYRVLDSALTNNYFNHSCLDFKDRLMRAELVSTGFPKPRRSAGRSKFELIRELFAQRQQQQQNAQEFLLSTQFKSNSDSNTNTNSNSNSNSNSNFHSTNRKRSPNFSSEKNSDFDLSKNSPNFLLTDSSSFSSSFSSSSSNFLANNNNNNNSEIVGTSKNDSISKNGCLPKLRINLAAKRIRLIIPQNGSKNFNSQAQKKIEETAANFKISSSQNSGQISMTKNFEKNHVEDSKKKIPDEKTQKTEVEKISGTEKFAIGGLASNGNSDSIGISDSIENSESIGNSPSAFSEFSGLKRIQDGPLKAEELLSASLSAPTSPQKEILSSE